MVSDELVRTHYNTAKLLAHQMRIPTDSIGFDDFVQEGAVAAWLATKDTERTNPVTYGMVAARRRIADQLSGRRPMLGSEREGGRIHDVHRKPEMREELSEDHDWTSVRDEFAETDLRLAVQEVLEDLPTIERGIAQGLSEGLSWTQIGTRLGTTSNAAQKRWRARLRPMLAERLAHVA